MKNTFGIIIIVAVVIFAITLFKFSEYKEKQEVIADFNVQYEQYVGEELYGTTIATIINKAVNDNEIANANKENENVQENDISVNIEVKIIDFNEEKIYNMDTLYNGGITNFVKYYGSIKFKCTNIQYNSEKRVKYMLFEQISK